MRHKLIRITTVAWSLNNLLKGQLNFMSQFYEVIGVSSGGEFLDKVKNNEMIRTHAIEMTRQISLGKDLISFFELYWFLRQEKPMIVHTHTPKAGIIGMLAARLAGVPIRLHTVAGLPLMEADGAKRKVLNFVEILTYRCATKVYPNSKGLSDFIVQNNFISIDKLKVVGSGSSNGIDTHHFSQENFSFEFKESLRRDMGILNEDFVFVFIGRLVSHKGINELVSAFRKVLNSSNKRCKLILVGPYENELDPLLPDTLNELTSNQDILSTGYQDDVRPYLAISNSLVFPSYREGFPNVVMQAGAMGLPCIVTDINGCNEIIINGENGIIIPRVSN